MAMRRALSLLNAAALGLLYVAGSSPPVKVALESSWPSPPLRETVLETVSLEYPDKYFNFLDQLSNPERFPLTSRTVEEEHRAALVLAVEGGIIQDPEALARIQMNLVLSSATPKLEAFYNYYEANYENQPTPDCESWVDWYGKLVCDVETLAQVVGEEPTDHPLRPLKLLPFDHIYPSRHQVLERPPRMAILYGTLSAPNFRELHSYLLNLANASRPQLEYVFRPISSRSAKSTRYNLTGYGVALDLKKMDYLALDDRHQDSSASQSAPDCQGQEILADPVLPLILAHPENANAQNANAALTTEELSELGAKAIQVITSSSNPLATFVHLAQNFPKYVTSLSRRVVISPSISEELQSNSLRAQSGANIFWLNGMQISPKDVNPFDLLRLLKKEKELLGSLVEQGLTKSQALELLTHHELADMQGGSGSLDTIFDASDRLEGGDVITWWNDIEKDSRYSRLNPSLYGLLRPMFPGSMPSVRLNLFNVVLLLDLSQIQSLNLLTGPVSTIINRGIPLRFGLVPLIGSENGEKITKLFYHLIQKYGRKRTLEFLKLVSQIATSQHPGSPTIDWISIQASYDNFIEDVKQDDADTVHPELSAIVEYVQESSAPIDKMKAYTERLGCMHTASSRGHAFFNGKHINVNDDFLMNIQTEMNVQMNALQQKVYDGTLSDEDNMTNYFYDLPTTNKRRNAYIYPSQLPGSLKIVNFPELLARVNVKLSSSFLYPPDFTDASHSLYVIADLDSDDGLALVKEALLSVTPQSRTRLAFLHNPANPQTMSLTERAPVSWLMSHLHVHDLLSKATPSSLLSVFEGHTAGPTEGTQTPLDGKNTFDILTDGTPLDKFSSEDYVAYVKQSRLLARELGLAPGQKCLVINGRIVGPIDAPTIHSFREVDFKTLEEYEFKKRTEPVLKALQEVAPGLLEDKYTAADIVSMSASAISSSHQPDPSDIGLFEKPINPRQRNYQLLDKEHTSFQLGDNSTALYHIAVLVDPLSESGQKWSSIVQWLSNIPDTFIEILLHPGKYTELPLKRFYRYNLPPSYTYDKDGHVNNSAVVFDDLPVDPIYTLAMDVPTSWLVRPREALYDLDNIQLGKLFPGDESVDAVFALDYIVVEGHARELAGGEPPRGVQLQLSKSDGTSIDDTQVVANLGYFQFKARPGVFHLEIRPGPGQKIFKLDSAGNEGWHSPSVETAGNEITITSFGGLTLYPRLSRLPGMETADVLKDHAAPLEFPKSGLFERMVSGIKSVFGFSEDAPRPVTSVESTHPQAVINIFTVASGLLYERFVGIMILSVLRNTNSTVKFWFIENFLSPSFLDFIPHMAEKYNFQYELITYKWPSWLRAQTEKQRVIWAYKILFLDVLFPMDLKKVIFVDADQIVRTDLKELVDLDLHGAPYGYTPMGDDNKDMEGFRFWKWGYWQQVLRGKPYHISALYVIDLVRFRQLAAGDILRGHYQQLSADPNSLANLDQDLPNNLQEQVPIYSLHEDWLWCETWCSKDRLHRAKTIDLCQNPLTKEPKLARARQIPEWEKYDAEIAQFTRELAVQGKIHTRMATADTNILAGGGVQADTAHIKDDSESQTPREDGTKPERGEEPSREEL